MFSFLPITEAGALGVHLETNIFVAEMEMGKKFCLQKQFPSEFKQHTLI